MFSQRDCYASGTTMLDVDIHSIMLLTGGTCSTWIHAGFTGHTYVYVAWLLPRPVDTTHTESILFACLMGRALQELPQEFNSQAACQSH